MFLSYLLYDLAYSGTQKLRISLGSVRYQHQITDERRLNHRQIEKWGREEHQQKGNQQSDKAGKVFKFLRCAAKANRRKTNGCYSSKAAQLQCNSLREPKPTKKPIFLNCLRMTPMNVSQNRLPIYASRRRPKKLSILRKRSIIWTIASNTWPAFSLNTLPLSEKQWNPMMKSQSNKIWTELKSKQKMNKRNKWVQETFLLLRMFAKLLDRQND